MVRGHHLVLVFFPFELRLNDQTLKREISLAYLIIFQTCRFVLLESVELVIRIEKVPLDKKCIVPNCLVKLNTIGKISRLQCLKQFVINKTRLCFVETRK